jgi:hypothetical protein
MMRDMHRADGEVVQRIRKRVAMVCADDTWAAGLGDVIGAFHDN